VIRVLLALLAAFVVAPGLGDSAEQIKIRVTPWNLEWFPNGSSHDATPEVQAQRIAAAADVLRPDRQVHNRLRKGTQVPYMTHLLGVASLVVRDVSDPDL
jgi:hypothetical protein